MAVVGEPFKKTNDEIAAEHDVLRALTAQLAGSGYHDRAQLEATLALHQRLGEMWMWMRENR
jgi:hypothetical protein